MFSIAENLKAAAAKLGAADIPDPARESRLILAFALGKPLTFLYTYPEYTLSSTLQIRFDAYVSRRAAHEPYQYISGRQEFYNLDFVVTPDVLIPRPETELLVTAALDILKNSDAPGFSGFCGFCEVGTGSGCIAVSLLHSRKDAHGAGLDISPAALKVTLTNAANNGVAQRLTLRESDVFSALRDDEKFGLIVSNPPYVPAADIPGLQIEVKDHEPLRALTDDGDGLSIIRRLILESPRHLSPGGHLLIEIGFGQAEAVREMVSFDIWQSLEFLADFQRIPRVVRLKLR